MKKLIETIRVRISTYSFMFSELVKRDFKAKYKRTVLGMVWSLLSPLLTLLVMRIVFTEFFGRNTPYYTTYLFSGNLVFAFYRDATTGGMSSLINNKEILSKINVPKYIFLLSRTVSALVNFALTLVVYFIFCAFDGIHFGFHMLTLVYPILCLLLMNIGIGLVLSAWFVFYRDVQYLYDVFLTLLMYFSAIFYQIDSLSPALQKVFLCNPVYVYIKYFRIVVIDHCVPSIQYHVLCLFYAVFFLVIGGLIYKKHKHDFLYYM